MNPKLGSRSAIGWWLCFPRSFHTAKANRDLLIPHANGAVVLATGCTNTRILYDCKVSNLTFSLRNQAEPQDWEAICCGMPSTYPSRNYHPVDHKRRRVLRPRKTNCAAPKKWGGSFVRRRRRNCSEQIHEVFDNGALVSGGGLGARNLNNHNDPSCRRPRRGRREPIWVLQGSGCQGQYFKVINSVKQKSLESWWLCENLLSACRLNHFYDSKLKSFSLSWY